MKASGDAPTGLRNQARHPTLDDRARLAKRLFDDLMDTPREIRRDFIAGLDQRDLDAVLRQSAKQGGTAYILWQDDPYGFLHQVLAETAWSKQRQVLEAIGDHKRVAVPSCFASGKCVGRAERIPLADGRVVAAADLVGATFDVMAWREDGTQVPTPARAQWNQIETVYRVTTTNGRSVVRNAEHPLWAADAKMPRQATTPGRTGRYPQPRGWTPVRDLRVGDLVLAPIEHQAMGQTSAPAGHAALLGYLLGDGGTGDKQITFTQQPGPALDEFRALCDALDVDVIPKDRRPHCYRLAGRLREGQHPNLRNRTNQVLALVREWGMFGVLAPAKRLPDWAWTLPNNQLATVMGRLFACDGWVFERSGTKGPRAAVAIALSSERLIDDVHLAMLRLGIPGAVRHRRIRYKDGFRDAWEWCATSRHALARFAEVIDMPGKNEKMRRVADAASSHVPARGFREWMHRNCPDGYRWERIREIEEQAPQMTVAIEVPGEETFLTTLVEHNTHLAARAALWRSMVFPVGTSLTVTTATRFRQVKTQLWPHIRSAVAKADLPVMADTTQLSAYNRDGVRTMLAYGFTAPPGDEAAVQGVHCVDDQTELLTDRGWLPFPKVTGEERVLTLNGDKAEWGPITKVWRHPFKGDLNVHDGQRVNFAITDEHRLLVRSRKEQFKRWSRMTESDGVEIKRRFAAGESRREIAPDFGVSATTIRDVVAGRRDGRLRPDGVALDAPRYALTPYSDLPQQFIVRRTNEWGDGIPTPSRMRLGAPARPYRPAEEYDFDYMDWVEFLGWYVAEGCVTQGRHGRRRVGVAQSDVNPTNRRQIRDLLTRMGVQVREGSKEFTFTSDSIGEWLRENVGTRSQNLRVPDEIKNGATEVIRRFLDAYGLGDGTAHTHPESRRYITSSKGLADDVHEMLAKIGRARKMRIMHHDGDVRTGPCGETWIQRGDVWVVTEAGVPVDSDVLKANVEKVPYDGMVYCVSTPHQTIMIRRKGCAMWSGNSARLFIVVDEAGGISRTIGGALRGLLTGEDTRLLAIGNPPTDDEDSWFEGFSDSDATHTVTISAYDAPQQTGETTDLCRVCPPEVAPHGLGVHLVGQDWIEETIADYGADSPFVSAKVHARFPRGGPGRAIPADWIDAACREDDPEELVDYVRLCDLGLPDEDGDPTLVQRGAWVRLGVDVAADGGDEMSIARCVGDVAHLVHTSTGSANINAVDVAGKVLAQIRRATALRNALGGTAQIEVKIDAIGVGWGVASTLEAWASEGVHDAKIVAVIVSEATLREDDAETLRPFRKRDEMWLTGRSLLQPRGDDQYGALRLKIDKRTKAQLSAPSYVTNSGGRTVIESKKSMRNRGVNSPDRAESLLLSIYSPIVKKKGGRFGLIV